MFYFFDVSKQKLFLRVIISELEVGMIAIIVSPLNSKKAATRFLYVIKHMLRLILGD